MTVETEWKLPDIARERLRSRAEDLDISVTDLAAKVGMPRPTLAKILTGDGDVGVARIHAICDALGLTIDYILTGRGSPTAAESISIPVAKDVAASAGDGALSLDFDEFEPLPFPRDWLRGLGDPKNLAMIQVKGDSMFPLINSGDWVIFDHSRTGPADGVYLIRHEGELLVKRVDFFDAEIRIRSENRHWPEKAAPYSALDDAAILQIIGRVVWTGRLLN